jgi:predicted Ser/Thr protein kinase
MSPTLTQIGRYRIERELGRGGMGVVYKAFDPVVERTLAIKTIRLEAEGTEDLVLRLKREAKSVGQLEHPNIVTLYDAGESAGLFYMAMQFVQGETLQDRIDHQRWFNIREILELFRQICAGLDYAHQRGVIHRDIKPANIMITTEGVVKLTDFGIAKLAGGSTSTGIILGTPSYMSPEQALGKPVDGRSDIFSLGSVLYEMVTGEKAFPGQNTTTVMYKIVHEPPTPITALQPGLDPAIEAIVLRALAKNPEQRFQTCTELSTALELYLNQVAAAMPKTTVASVLPLPPSVPPATPVPGPATPYPTPVTPYPAGVTPYPAGATPYPAGVTPYPAGVSPVPAGVTPYPAGVTPYPASAPTAIQGPAPGMGTQPVPTPARVPLAWLGAGALGAFLIVVVILLAVLVRRPTPVTTNPAANQAASPDATSPSVSSGAATQPPGSSAALPAAESSIVPSQPAVQQPAVSSAPKAPKPPALTPAKPTPRPALVSRAPAAKQPVPTPATRELGVTAAREAVPERPRPTSETVMTRSETPSAPPVSVPETFDSLMVKGDVAFQQGRYQEALGAYSRAYSLRPRHPGVRRKIVLVLTMLGRGEEARKYQ